MPYPYQWWNPPKQSKKKEKKVPKQVKSYVKQAIKSNRITDYYKYSSTSTEITSTMSATPICSITQGDGAQQRIGDVVDIAGIHVKFHIIQDKVSTQLPRILIIQWKPDNAEETPTATELLENPTDPQSQITEDKAERAKFTVLYDGFFPLLGSASNTSVPKRDFWISGKKVSKIKFEGAQITGKNMIYLCTIGNYASGSCLSWAYSFITKFRETV